LGSAGGNLFEKKNKFIEKERKAIPGGGRSKRKGKGAARCSDQVPVGGGKSRNLGVRRGKCTRGRYDSQQVKKN